jgi:hypothetical protein
MLTTRMVLPFSRAGSVSDSQSLSLLPSIQMQPMPHAKRTSSDVLISPRATRTSAIVMAQRGSGHVSAGGFTLLGTLINEQFVKVCLGNLRYLPQKAV